jgi:elongation factor P--beta-lysine ligase
MGIFLIPWVMSYPRRFQLVSRLIYILQDSPSCFDLGFKRLVAYVTGIQVVRDVIAFLKTPGNASY